MCEALLCARTKTKKRLDLGGKDAGPARWTKHSEQAHELLMECVEALPAARDEVLCDLDRYAAPALVTGFPTKEATAAFKTKLNIDLVQMTHQEKRWSTAYSAMVHTYFPTADSCNLVLVEDCMPTGPNDWILRQAFMVSDTHYSLSVFTQCKLREVIDSVVAWANETDSSSVGDSRHEGTVVIAQLEDPLIYTPSFKIVPRYVCSPGCWLFSFWS